MTDIIPPERRAGAARQMGPAPGRHRAQGGAVAAALRAVAGRLAGMTAGAALFAAGAIFVKLMGG
jgi:hypothetical protein